MKRLFLAAVIVAALCGSPAAEQPKATPALTADLVRGLELRGLGPALVPGRVGDIAVDPRDAKVWYVVAASGGLWKTTDAGQTWQPLFDHYGSYSLGCITLDPANPEIVWLGTGENQAQRSVSFGDGIYKSTDGGKTWKHLGLAASEHLAKIVIDPRNSDVVYVAAQGPLWAPGGDRGLYKTTDGGKTWAAVLTVSENTGVTDVVLDPRNPDVLYAASYQRRRNVGVLVGGGPESAIFKSTDGGKKWQMLTKGLPEADTGRIALGISPQQPDVVYALVTAAGQQGGFFRSADGGASWSRQSNYKVVDPQYYGRIFPDPHQFDRVFAVDVSVHVTEDGGKKFVPAGWKAHSDNHALAFDPKDPGHLLLGNDGGLYETFDRGKTWKHFTNLPTTQFYRICVDNSEPFYRVYGGSQDNGTVGGPSRTAQQDGIRTADWQRYGGGDGMQPRADPDDPNTVYVTSQYGAITRTEKGKEGTPIRPKTGKGSGVRWNWDTPFLISPHSSKRLYLAGSVLFRSEDRGDSWKAISPDLTRQLDRDKVPVMGKLWGPDAVSRNLFTTDLSVATALTESPLKEGLLWVGTDDGLVQFTDDGGKSWTKIDRFPDMPEQSYVSALLASRHNADTVYVAFNNWQRGDFKPYLLRSIDRGKTWTSLAATLPDRHPVWCLAEDHVSKDVLFAGTEFGLFATADGGSHWVPLRGGLPVVAVRDLDVQRRENDLVLATFGRGFYVLDDYTPLRHLTSATLAKVGVLFAPRKAYRYEPPAKADGPAGFTTSNPPFGAVLTYYLRADLPEGATVVLTVADGAGKAVRQLSGPTTAGLHRVAWDLNTPNLAPAGKYRVGLAAVVKGVANALGETQELEVVPLAR
jgi:photosystem II stability/assembly factor-like uncharacterized protein